MSAPRMGHYRLLVEVNRLYDVNEFYRKQRFPDDPIYNGDGKLYQDTQHITTAKNILDFIVADVQ